MKEDVREASLAAVCMPASHFHTTKLKVCLTTGHVVGEGVKKQSITIWYIILQLLWIQTGIFYLGIKSLSLDITGTGKAQ